MPKACSPLFPLILLVAALLLVSGLAWYWQAHSHQASQYSYDRSGWLLAGLLMISVVGTGIFLTYAFLHIWGC